MSSLFINKTKKKLLLRYLQSEAQDRLTDLEGDSDQML